MPDSLRIYLHTKFSSDKGPFGLSVCHVTLRYNVNKTKHMMMRFSPNGSLKTLVSTFQHPKGCSEIWHGSTQWARKKGRKL